MPFPSGPKVVNLSVVFGSRFRGIAGAVSAFAANTAAVLIWTLAVMSLFAVGGAKAAVPEMRRIAVDVQRWMTDQQFADVFAMARLSRSQWPTTMQDALVPLSIGLMAVSGLIVIEAADRNWTAVLFTAAAAVIASATRLNPLWLLLAEDAWVLLAQSEENR